MTTHTGYKIPGLRVWKVYGYIDRGDGRPSSFDDNKDGYIVCDRLPTDYECAEIIMDGEPEGALVTAVVTSVRKVGKAGMTVLLNTYYLGYRHGYGKSPGEKEEGEVEESK